MSSTINSLMFIVCVGSSVTVEVFIHAVMRPQEKPPAHISRDEGSMA